MHGIPILLIMLIVSQLAMPLTPGIFVGMLRQKLRIETKT